MTIWSPFAIRQYQRLLARTRLNPRRIGWNPLLCDEVPIYSRRSQLGAIVDLPREQRELLILRMAVQFWLDAEANLIALPFQTEYMLFLSLWNWADEDLPQPYVFFCGINVPEIRDKWRVEPAVSKSSELIRSYLKTFEVGASARLFEDRNTVPGETRVLIDFDLTCNPHKVRFK